TLSEQVEGLDAAVLEIEHSHAQRAVQHDTARPPQLSGIAAERARFPEPRAARVEALQPVERPVGDVEPAEGVHRQAAWPGNLDRGIRPPGHGPSGADAVR